MCCSLAVEIAKGTSSSKRNGIHLLKMENYSCSRLSQEIRLEQKRKEKQMPFQSNNLCRIRAMLKVQLLLNLDIKLGSI